MAHAVKPALVVLALAAGYLLLNIGGNYGGNPTGPFFTGRSAALPPSLASHTARTEDPAGYDGQFYHLVAHDPLLLRGFDRYVDNPRLRWRRIGVPGAAALLGFGHPDLVYIGLQLLFTFAGAYWLARYARERGAPEWLGFGFAVVPAVMVSLDRMTVDLVLAALTVGFVLYSGDKRVYPILFFAPLVRETGMLLVAGWCVWAAAQRRWRAVAAGAACGVGALAWWLYVHARTAPDATPWLARYPFSGLIDRTAALAAPSGHTLWLQAASAAEIVALAGLWVAFGCGLALIVRRRFGLAATTAIIFVAFAALLGKADIWESAYAAGRTMSPLLVLLFLIAIDERRWTPVLPLLLLLPRLALQYQAQVFKAFRSLG